MTIIVYVWIQIIIVLIIIISVGEVRNSDIREMETVKEGVKNSEE